MKKVILFALTFTLLGNVIACDICGGGAGGSYLGLLPEFRKRFFGLRYQHNQLMYHLGPGGSSTYLTTKEYFHVAELWGAVNIGNKFRITGFVPYNFISRQSSEGSSHKNGIGDLTFIGYYQLMSRKHTNARGKTFAQSLWVGVGVKLPTGEYDPEDKNVESESQNSYQLGTASTDFSLHAMYDLRYQFVGLNINTSYRVNTRNRYDYHYGDKFTANALAYYKIQVSHGISIAPNAGILFESAAKDNKGQGIDVWQTGGTSLMGTVGLECSFKRVNAGVNWQTPLSQKLGEGMLKAGDRGMAHVSFSF